MYLLTRYAKRLLLKSSQGKTIKIKRTVNVRVRRFITRHDCMHTAQDITARPSQTHSSFFQRGDHSRGDLLPRFSKATAGQHTPIIQWDQESREACRPRPGKSMSHAVHPRTSRYHQRNLWRVRRSDSNRMPPGRTTSK